LFQDGVSAHAKGLGSRACANHRRGIPAAPDGQVLRRCHWGMRTADRRLWRPRAYTSSTVPMTFRTISQPVEEPFMNRGLGATGGLLNRLAPPSCGE
jgi:hypothetical protein